ncbi:MAG: hypothetical protein SFU98_13705 [Leptospiraceae bacterium]|nr:hypothetical protein [Leptospiraceae bacterium]
MESKYTKEMIEEIMNWILPGLTMYYRDTELEVEIVDKYRQGMVFRSQTFVDVSGFAGKPTKNCRFIFASSKAAPIYELNPLTEKWRLHVINANSYFKILDIYKKENKTQFFLLHIPAKAVDLFSNNIEIVIKDSDIEQQIIEKARNSFNEKMLMSEIEVFEEFEWLDRTSFPIGLDNNNDFFSLYPNFDLPPEAILLSNAIKKMTNDTELNDPF